MRLTELGIEHADQWLEFYDRGDTSLIDVFDLPGYMEACESAGHGTPKCLVVEDGKSLLIYPLLIDMIHGFSGLGDVSDTSSPYGYGGTITNRPGDDQNFFDAANALIDEWMRDQNVVSEFIRASPYKANTDIRPGDYVQVRTNIQIETSSIDESWSTLNSSAKRNIRKSEANGLSVGIVESGTAMKEFADFYTEFARSRDWDEFYQFPLDYFAGIQNNLPDDSFIVRAELDGKFIAGALFLTSDTTTHFHLGASNPDHLGIRPNDAIFWEAIKYSAENHKSTLQLGGGTGMSADDPLFRFKSKFGKTQLPVYVGKRIINQPAYDELISQWSARNPDSPSTSSQILQRYRN